MLFRITLGPRTKSKFQNFKSESGHVICHFKLPFQSENNNAIRI